MARSFTSNHGPDFSDSDDNLCDDGDYFNFKERTKSLNIRQRPDANDHLLTEKEKEEQIKKDFYSALCSGNKERIINFLDDGLNVNVNLQNEWTPLLLSVSFGNYDITHELLKRGATINSIRNGMTALMMACNCPQQTSPFEESYKIVKMLVENGANVTTTNRKRMTALMFAANSGNLLIVKYLFPLSNKCAVDNQKWTVLFWAVNGNAVDVVQYLLQEELDYNIIDIRSSTPLDLARSKNFTEIMSLFPKNDTDCLNNFLSSYPTDYEEIASLKPNQRPYFSLDIFGILSGVRCDSVAKLLSEKNISLFDFLSSSYEDLKELGVKLPYQRERIIAGIHKFHKHPYHPDSLHVIPLDVTFSNLDATIQLISIIKQVIAMEASLYYIRKRYHSKEPIDDQNLLKNLQNIRNRIQLCRITNRKLLEKVKKWDIQTKPVDFINKDSVRYRAPWRKIIFVSIFSTITVVIYLRR